MAKIFTKQADITQHPNRNNFSWTHNVYGTYKSGYLYPNFFRILPPTSSIRIDTKMFMNFMPTSYPLQSGVAITQYFFAVPLRLLWDKYENWAMRLDNESEPPIIDAQDDKFFTGSIYDYLDVPTTIVSDTPLKYPVTSLGVYPSTAPYDGARVRRYYFPEDGMVVADEIQSTIDGFMSAAGSTFFDDDFYYLKFKNAILGYNTQGNPVTIKQGNGWSYPSGMSSSRVVFGTAIDVSGLELIPASDGKLTFTYSTPQGFVPVYGSPINTPRIAIFCHPNKDAAIDDCQCRFVGGTGVISKPSGSPYESIPESWSIVAEDVPQVMDIVRNYKDGTVYFVFLLRFSGGTINLKTPNRMDVNMSIVEPRDWRDIPGLNPFKKRDSTDEDTIPLSALPLRAYEMCYNSFFRDKTGAQPFVVDGKTIYNDWLPSKDGGFDDYDYKLHQRNWEKDAYTSCMPSPQLGDAPLVGISNIDVLGGIHFQNEDGSTTKIGEVREKDGVIQVTDVDASTEEQRKSLVRYASSGISIADFRQTNAFQTFLEQTLRSGLTYFDFIRGHFGKGPKKAELQMPEFIGGATTKVVSNQISNTNAQGEVPLGAYAGQVSAFGQSKHTAGYYADDHTAIIGMVCIVPDAAYSQMLPRHWRVNDPLDLYYPEFGQLGLQPVTYEEVTPVQSKLDSLSDNTKKLTDVFGYQRPNHDLVWHPDTLHGEFRRTLNRWVVNRRFGSRPILGNEFLTIDPAELQRSFTLTTAEAGSGDDIAVGQIRHEIKVKLPVHKIVVPSLGR